MYNLLCVLMMIMAIQPDASFGMWTHRITCSAHCRTSNGV